MKHLRFAVLLAAAVAGLTSCSDSAEPIPTQDAGPGVFFVEASNDTTLPATDTLTWPGCTTTRTGGYFVFGADGTFRASFQHAAYSCGGELSGGWQTATGRYQVDGSTLTLTGSDGVYSGELPGTSLRAATRLALSARGSRLRLRRESNAAEAVRRQLQIEDGASRGSANPSSSALFLLESVNDTAPPYPVGTTRDAVPFTVTDGYVLLTGAGEAMWWLRREPEKTPAWVWDDFRGQYDMLGKVLRFRHGDAYDGVSARLDQPQPAGADTAWIDLAPSYWYPQTARGEARFRFRRERDATAAVQRIWDLRYDF